MFLCRAKPTSPAKRNKVCVGNQFFRKFKYRKFMPVSTRSNFEDKKTNRKRLTSPSTKFYYFYRGMHHTSQVSRVLNVSKVTYSNFLTATVSFGSKALFNIKAPCGFLLMTKKRRSSFLDTKRWSYSTGDSIPLYFSPTGGQIFSLRVVGFRAWRVAESAGTFCKVLWHDFEKLHTAMYLPTKGFFRLNCFSDCIVGRVSNRFHQKAVYGGATTGIKKRKKIISVRGIAKNPVDHPNGGRANTRRPMRNPWGKVAKKGK